MSTGIPSGVRPHHWGFANAWLRSSFERIPETLVSGVAAARGPEPVVESWRRFGATLDESERMEPEGLDAATYAAVVDGTRWFLAVVELPEPERSDEAWFAGLAVRPEGGELEPEPEESEGAESGEGSVRRSGTETRYFLLERTGPDSTDLIEWVDDERIERRVGVEPDTGLFVETIVEELER